MNESDYEDAVVNFYEGLYAFGYSLTGNQDDASELTQETFYRLLTRGGMVRDSSKIKSWLFTTLYRVLATDNLKPRKWNLYRWSTLPLRLIVGYGFMEHGYAKLIHGPERFAAILHTLGVPAPELMAWATIMVELLGGLAVLLGAFIALASVPMACVLLTAMFTVHLQYGFSSIKIQAITTAGAQFGPPGYEVDLLYLACLAALVLIGSGPFSIGSLLTKRSNSKFM